MNKEMKKTAIFAGTALVLVLIAYFGKASPKAAEVFSDQGQEFYPAFKDPLKAAALEVVDFDGLTGVYRPFKVQVVNGQWSIPSHHNYPADGKERLKNTAASVMDLRKERIASEDPKLHEEFGVVDPLDPAAPGTKGRGKRVRLFDGSGTPLADYIFGKETQDGGGRRYVRIPGQKRTYVIKTQPDISVKFEDWVETDLLQLASASIKKLVVDKYTFDEEKGDLKNRSTQFLAQEDSVWKLGELKATEDVNTETVNTLTSTLSGLKLAGVRPKPPVVAKAKDMGALDKLPQQQLMMVAQSMAQHGFFIMREGPGRYSVVSNEGELQVSCDDGVIYTLRFGEVLVGTGEEISAGKDEPKKDKKDKKDDKKDEKKEDKKDGTESRYLFVGVRYDESLVGPAPVEPKPYVADPAKKPEEQKADEEKSKKDKEEYDRKKKDVEKKKEDGKKRAEKLTARFADWYYVISSDAFKKLRVDRAQLVKPKEAPKDEKKPDDKDHKHDEKKAEDKKPDAKPDEKKPEDKKPEDKKLDEKKPEEKKPEEKKPEEKKAEDKPKPPDEKKPEEKKP